MADDVTYTKPLPDPNPATQPFWDAAREHRLRLQRSAKTGQFIYYPRAVSPFGAGDTLTWEDVSGRGHVWSYTVARRATAPAFESDVPYVIAIVELEEGPHMTANIIDCDPDTVRVGLPVEAAFVDVTPEVTLVQFRPRAAPAE